MTVSSVIQSIVRYLRAGYPEGVPEHDYIPLFALLRRRLSDDEVEGVVTELVADSPDPDVTSAHIRAVIEAVTRSTASEADVARVADHLASVGWNAD